VGAAEVAARVRAYVVPNRTDPTQVVLRRCVAKLVDALLVAAILLVVVFVAGDVRRSTHGCPDPIPKGRSCLGYNNQAFIVDNRVFFWFFGTLVVLLLLVFPVTSGITGATPGKLLMRIRVVRHDGSKPGWKRGLVRAAAWGVDALALILPLGLWIASFTPRHRRIGDYLAGTYVVRGHAVGRPVPRRAASSPPPQPEGTASPALGV
jgi:uncharacterized RDD family membrane protein YckC